MHEEDNAEVAGDSGDDSGLLQRFSSIVLVIETVRGSSLQRWGSSGQVWVITDARDYFLPMYS